MACSYSESRATSVFRALMADITARLLGDRGPLVDAEPYKSLNESSVIGRVRIRI